MENTTNVPVNNQTATLPAIVKTEYIYLHSMDGFKIKVDRKIQRMSIVINDAVCDDDFPSEIEDVQSITDNDDADAPSENNITWPEIPCFLVKREFIKLIVEYCEHFNYYRELDMIPMPIAKPGVEERHTWLDDKWSIEWIGKLKLH